MAVASLVYDGGTTVGPVGFHPPKRADIRYWYKAASVGELRKRLPLWVESYRERTTIDEQTIMIQLHGATLMIARKRHLK